MKWGFVALALLAFVAHAWALVARDSMLPPDQDPWYQPPDGWQKAKPGTIFRSRKVDITTFVKDNVKEAWQLLYRTTFTSDDEPKYTATTVIVPHNADSDKLVVFGTWVDSNAPKCAPSYAWRNGLTKDVESVALAANTMIYLQQGYIVTVPDKGGKHNAFGSGFVEGRQTLDGVRATLAFDKIGLSKDTKVAGSGYSGGSLQTGWAAALRNSYAPELNMVGWALGGTLSNVTSFMEKVNGNAYAGYFVGVLTGLYDSYDSVKNYLDKVLTKKGKAAMEFARKNCAVSDLIHFAFLDAFKTDFSSAGKDLLQADEMQKVLKTLTWGVNEDYKPMDPLLILQSSSDEVTPYDSARRAYHAWCDQGVDIEFVTFNNPLAAHSVTFITTIVPMFMWVRDRLEGRPLKKGCSDKKNGFIGVNPNALGEDFRGFLNILKGLLGDKIGPNDKYLIDNLQKNS